MSDSKCKGCKLRISVIIGLALFINPKTVFSETLILKSGQKIEGKILEKTEEYIKIDFQGVTLTYFLDEIENIPAKPRAFKTAIITYNLSGLQNGEEIVYIDGNKFATDVNVTETIAGVSRESKVRYFFDGENVFVVNCKNQEAIKMNLPQAKGIKDNTPVYLNEGSFKNYPVENEKLLNRDCKVYKVGENKFYFCDGILLKQIMYGEYDLTKEAIDIKIDVPVPEEKFKVPDNFKIIDEKESLRDLEKPSH
jgi:hypothetical protein